MGGEESAIQSLTSIMQAILHEIREAVLPVSQIKQDLAVLKANFENTRGPCADHREALADLEKRLRSMETENKLLLDRMSILAKVLWAFAVPLIGLLAKAFWDLLMTHHGAAPPITSGSLIGMGAGGITLMVSRIFRL